MVVLGGGVLFDRIVHNTWMTNRRAWHGMAARSVYVRILTKRSVILSRCTTGLFVDNGGLESYEYLREYL